jgi:hypothetical protein
MTTRTLPTAFRLVVAVAVLTLLLAPALAPLARGGSSGTTLPLTGAISGPSQVGTGLTGSYTVTAHGGPAEALNDSQVGTYSYEASVSAANTTGAAVTPSAGVLIGFTITVTLDAPNVSEPLTIYILVNSSYNGASVSQNFSFSLQVIEPYRLAANLVVGSTSAVSNFDITVLLDGQPVGQILVHGLSAGTSYPISFAYVPSSLSPGWHTFFLSLAQEHGLVTFAGGQQTLSVSFYVAGGGPNYSYWYLAGAATFVGAIFIWSTTVGGRRRGRPKK